jgi:hypothetical protein
MPDNDLMTLFRECHSDAHRAALYHDGETFATIYNETTWQNFEAALFALHLENARLQKENEQLRRIRVECQPVECGPGLPDYRRRAIVVSAWN